jgi:hypothetical protein
MSKAQGSPLRELAETVAHELALQSVPSRVHVDGFPEPRPDCVYVLMDPWAYVAVEGDRALPDDAILRRTIFLCVEPPPRSAHDPHLELLERAGAVFTIDPRSLLALQRLGIAARLMRPGYSRSLDHFDPTAQRPVDVTFLGTHTSRRTRYFNRAARVLARYNCALHLVAGGAPGGEAGSAQAREKWALLAQTKVLVNLHGGEETRLEWRRVLDGIHAGAVVVSEHSSGIAPLVAGEHVLMASADALPYVAESVLADEVRLARIRAEAYERLSTWIPFALPVSVLRAAVVELVGEPVAPDVALGTPRPAQVTPGLHLGREMPVAPARSTRVSAEVLQESPAWSPDGQPRVSVITVIGNAAEPLVVALESVIRSTTRDFELVLVDSGRDDGARAAAAGWIDEHPEVPARLVAGAPGAGLGGARNAGVAAARGARCLILDPGQEVYPRCIDRLATALDERPEVAFVYPIQEVTGAADEFAGAGGDYLMSVLDWTPERLRGGNYIHAPALVRTEVVRALGGFVADERLRGFEDYDLWCRIAEHGGSGYLVAEPLARRPESGRSETLGALRPSPGPATRALAGRAPRLLAGAF